MVPGKRCGRPFEVPSYAPMESPGEEDSSVLVQTLLRWGGLLTAAAAVLYVISDSVALFFIFGQGGSGTGVFLRNIVAVYARVPLLVGLVALYVYQRKAIGPCGLVGFLEALVGTLLWPLYPVWPGVLASLGWVLFGALSLDAGVYSGAALSLLIVGAGLSGVANALTASGLLAGNLGFTTGVLLADIIFHTATVWLGFELFTKRSGKVQQSVPAS